MSANEENAPPFRLWEWAGVGSPWNLAAHAIERLERVYLWGPPGVGKSFLAASAAPSRYQVTLSEDATVQELMGHYVPEGDVFRWRHGPVTCAFKDGGLLVLNEIGRASPAVQDFLLGILDAKDIARLTLPSGQHLVPAGSFAVIATSNAAPDLLEPALRSRFDAEIHLPNPHPELTARINRDAPGLGDALRDSYLDPDRALDPRKLLSFVRLRANLPARQAAALAFGERAPELVAALTARGMDLS